MTAITTSGLYNWALSNADILLESFSRNQIHATALTRDHMVNARRSLNLELQSWSNRGVNMWEVNLLSITLASGTAQYDMPQETVSALDVYYSQVNGLGTGQNLDRIMLPISRSQYAAISNKMTPGTPTTYWFDRLTPIPTMTVWQPPSSGQDSPNYLLKVYYLRRVQDANITSGQTPDIPYRFIDALCAGVATRLAVKYMPSKYQMLKAEAKEAWDWATYTDQENAAWHVTPSISDYYPR